MQGNPLEMLQIAKIKVIGVGGGGCNAVNRMIESGLKEPLYLIFNRSCLADGVRYFLITAFAGCVWPITFKYFSKLSQNKKN